MQTTIFLTGGTGFLGAYIIKELVEKGYVVKAMRRSYKQLPFFIAPSIFEQVKWVQGDIMDVGALEEHLEGIDIVVHAAAKISFAEKDKALLFKTNVEGTANVVNAALTQKVKRLVHLSSVAALGRTITGDTVNENKKWEESDMHTHYAISKYQAELEVWRGISEGLPAVVVNPSTILGFGDWTVGSCAIFKNIYEEAPWYTKGINGFVDVEDVARATVRLMETNISNERFIVSGDNWMYRQLFNTMADAFGKKRPKKAINPFVAAMAWRIEKIKAKISGTEPLITQETIQLAQRKTYYDTSKLLKTLEGFEFTPLTTTIEKACKKYIERYR